MTLEEAIMHCEEKACGNSQCALEHKQLAKWLKELRILKSLPSDLDEAGKNYAELLPQGRVSKKYSAIDFIAGAKWDREQMMSKAVEVRVQTSPLNGPLGISAYCFNFPSKHPFYHCKEGDKVRIIIVKED